MCNLYSEEPGEDNVSADSGVGLTPLTGDTQTPQAEPTSTDQQQQPSQQSANSLEAAQAEAAKKAGINLDRMNRQFFLIIRFIPSRS